MHLHFGQSIVKCLHKVYRTLDRTVMSKHVHLIPIGYSGAIMYNIKSSPVPTGKTNPPVCHCSKALVGISTQNTSKPFLILAMFTMHCLNSRIRRHIHAQPQKRMLQLSKPKARQSHIIELLVEPQSAGASLHSQVISCPNS